MNTFAPARDTEEFREQFRAEQTKRTKTWIEDRLYDLADDIGRGYGASDKFTDLEIVAYIRGVRSTLECLAERDECGEISAFVQLHGALGERRRRRNSPDQKLSRRLFNTLITQIRDKRIAMLDQYESLAYETEFKVWQKRVWAIERAGVEREDWDDFQMLQRELRAVWELQHHLVTLKSWCDENWKRRQPAAQPATPLAA